MKYLLLLATVLISCGRAKESDDQDRLGVQLPKYPQEKGLSLVPATETQSFLGSWIIWHEKAGPKEIQAIAEASRNTRVIRAERTRYNLQEHKPKMLELQTIEKKYSDEFNQINELYNNESREGWRKLFTSWFDDEVSQATDLTAPQIARANLVFGLFCQSQIWRAALSPQISIEKFNRRPTPAQVCEGYYKKNNFFAGASCSDATAKNYFVCLWQEGVQKTEYFKHLKKEKKDEILSNWIQEGENSFLAKLLINAEKKEKLSKLIDIIMSQGLIKGTFLQELDVSKTDPRYSENGLFSYRVSDDQTNLSDALTPESTMSGVLSGRTTDNGVDVTLFTKDRMDLHKKFSDALSPLFSRNIESDITANDLIFNNERTKAYSDSQKNNAISKQSDMVNVPSLAKILSQGNQEVLAKLKAQRAKLDEIHATLLNPPTQAKLNEFDAAYDKIQMESLKAAVAPNATKAFWIGGGLDVSNDLNGGLIYKFSITGRGGKPIYGHWNLNQNRSEPCPQSNDIVCAETLVEKEKGHVKLRVSMNNPDLINFKARSSSALTAAQRTSGFNDVPLADVMPRTLVIDMYQNNLYGVMDFYSVTTKFCDASNQCIWEGAMNLLPP